ncbi:MAG: asparagine synthase [Candidatus Bathyarchaeota archaeon B23]|nr:MAG: asparagine synthase [Candidatus Bathyarchaeota archaeon B23]
MGYLAALLSKRGGDVSALTLRMLSSPGLRGDGLGLASKGGSISLPWRPSPPRGDAVIGCLHVKATPLDPPQPLSQHGHHIALEGRLWSEGCDALEMAEELGRDPHRGLRRLIEGGDGSYAVVILDDDRILCGRDPVGLVPLYIGESESLVAAASNRKMLWSLGLEAEPLKPGYIATLSPQGLELERVRVLEQPEVEALSMEEAVERLDEAMRISVERRVRGLSHVCLAFSGGLDSSVIARCLDLAGVDVELLSVGLEGSGDLEAAVEAAEHLDLPIRVESYGLRDVEEALDRVLWSVEEADPMKVSIALPLHWCAELAVEGGVRILFVGQGSDELFGGYRRYIDLYASIGEEVRHTLFRDVADSYEVNYARDYKVCMDQGVEVRAPYTDLRVVELALSLPMGLKLSREGGRKLILRRLAEALGLPGSIAWRRKRAIQYSTGVSRALRRIAKGRRLSLREYLEGRLRRLRQNLKGFTP